MTSFRLLSMLFVASMLALTGCGKSTTEKAADEARERLQTLESSSEYLSLKYGLEVMPEPTTKTSSKTSVDYPWNSRTAAEISEIEDLLRSLIVDVKRLNEIGDREDIALANREDIRSVAATAELYLKSLQDFRANGKSVGLDETETPPLIIRIK